MTVERDDVEHVARLAALALDTKTLDELTRQIGQILDYVSQLQDVAEDTTGGRGYPGPRQELRVDQAQHTALAISLEQMAPAFQDGLFLVPRLGAVGDTE